MSGKSITRRTFHAGVLSAGALAMAPKPVTAKSSANERINTAVIGLRTRGKQLAGAFHGSRRFNIVTLCDCDSAMQNMAMKSLEKALPVRPKLIKDFRRILDDKNVDAVAVATPDHWHAIMTLMALEAGKHVYLEKPASYNIEEGKAMMAAQHKYPKQVIAVGPQQRSGPHFHEAKKLLDSGVLGKIGFARAWILHRRPFLPKVPDTDPPTSLDYDLWLGPAPHKPYNEQRVHYNWHFMRDTGTGEIGNWGGHWIDVVRWFLNLDLPHAVSAHGGQFVTKDIKEWPDTQTVIYEYPELTVLWEQRLWTRFGVNGWTNGVEIVGEKGIMQINRSGWIVHRQLGKPERHQRSDLMSHHVKNFADSVAGTAQPACNIDEGCKTAAHAHLGNIATMLQRRIEFDPVKQEILNDVEAAEFLHRGYRAPWKLPT